MTPVQDAKTKRRAMRLFARDIMTSPVITAWPETRVKDLVALMTTHRISGIPIVAADHELIGIVTEADLLYKEILPKPTEPAPAAQRLRLPGVAVAAEHARKAEGLRAIDVMTAPVISVTEDATAHEIAGRMVKHKINRLPVLRAGRVVGIVSRADVLKVFRRSDEELTEAIREAIVNDLWVDAARLGVEVREGVVYLEGRLDRRSEKDLVEKWAQMADGVLGVESRLTYEVNDWQIPT
ncbi:MAG TPA: CBS domain-containing protein [bacterium]|nr:CBS domain-containing protein [bacterium]